jgi:uncharacterized repeat protein (TIGR03803 family)
MQSRAVSHELRAILAVITAALILASAARATDKEKLLHNFTGGRDGATSAAGLIRDAAGNLYGTTFSGGVNGCYSGCGVVFELTPTSSSGWKELVLHTFTGGKDGGGPFAALIMDSAGNLYGTTRGGTVFKLAPNKSGRWQETVLYTFCSVTNCADGADPWSSLIFDSAGNLYGTTYNGGSGTCMSGCGVVFKLTPSPHGWKETVLHTFTGGPDGANPVTGLALGPTGTLYGTTMFGGNRNNCSGISGYTPGCGVVFKLAPTSRGWKWSVMHTFTDGRDGANPAAGLTLDSAGKLYGTTYSGGNVNKCSGINKGCGVVFELTPTASGRSKENVLHAFTGGTDGGNPQAPVIFDAVGNLYGTTWNGPTTNGVVFELTPTSNGWKENVLHTFNGQDGANPAAGLTLDSAGNLFSTTYDGGKHGYGVVFELTATR